MAQKKGYARKEGLARLARRFGLTGGKLVAAACLVLVALAGSLGVAARTQGSGVTIERNSEAGAGSAEGEAGGSAASGADEGSNAAAGGSTAAAGGEGDETKGDGAGSAAAQPVTTGVVVHVDGAVQEPGVYALLSVKPRVEDAVAAAGGLAADADTSTVNLAALVADGTKVHIPREGEAVALAGAGAGTAAGASGGASETATATDASATGPAGLVNINTADSTQLQTLPGVGAATAQDILDDRQQNGPFKSKEDLMRVSGIGEKKYQKLEAMICV